jgi:serine/threonine-protein kinase
VKISPSLLPPQSSLVPGTMLGRYELLFPFAQGGMAVVWAARVQGKHGFEKLFAVKTILPHVARDEAFRTMFLDEARIASRIRHPNVASLEDLGEEAGTLYMVLEWVHGDSWSKLHEAVVAAGQTMPIDLLLRLAADACAGLHAAHELANDEGRSLHVVHRDVSPQNVLVTTTGITKVIDFGIAKARDRLAEQTQTGMLKGKVEYSAPEQIRMKGVDRRADVWAIGVMLYHELAGRLPFHGKDDLATLRAVAAGLPPPPLGPHVPPAVAAIVSTALRQSKDDRYATALDMQRALEAAITRPTTTTDVAAYLKLHLAKRLERRRADLAEALAEAAARAGEPVGPRARMTSFPELAPLADRPITLEDPSQVTAEAAAPPSLRAVHWLVMAVAVLVTIAVWGVVAYALVAPRPLTSHEGPA